MSNETKHCMDQNNVSVGSLGFSAPTKICLLTARGKSVPEELGKYIQQLKKPTPGEFT